MLPATSPAFLFARFILHHSTPVSGSYSRASLRRVCVEVDVFGGTVTAKLQRCPFSAKLVRPAHGPELVGPGLDRGVTLHHDMDHHAALPRLGLSLASTISMPRETISVWLGGGGHPVEPVTSRM